MNSKEKISEDLLRLLETMETLRGPEGCPWDKAQKPSDLNPHLLEETYETMEAVDSGDPERLQEELGDLLLQVVFQTQIARESFLFDMGDVARTITEKLKRRHPHVFAEAKVKGIPDVMAHWEQIKAEEKKAKGLSSSVMGGVPSSLPALLKAYRLGQKASRVGFDWPDLTAVIEKMREELKELETEILQKNMERMEEEMGDLLFSLSQIARFMKINPEDALRRACEKFIRRFRFVEDSLSSKGKDFHQTDAKELDELWNEAKKKSI